MHTKISVGTMKRAGRGQYAWCLVLLGAVLAVSGCASTAKKAAKVSVSTAATGAKVSVGASRAAAKGTVNAATGTARTVTGTSR